MPPYEIQKLLFDEGFALDFIKNFPRIERELKNYKYVSPQIVVDVTKQIENEQQKKLNYGSDNDETTKQIGHLLQIITQLLPQITNQIDPNQQQAMQELIQKYDAIEKSFNAIKDPANKLAMLSKLFNDAGDINTLIRNLSQSQQGIQDFLMSPQEITNLEQVSIALST